MKTNRVMVINEAELREELVEFYSGMIDTPAIRELVLKGRAVNSLIVDVMDEGLENMSVLTLCAVAKVWGEMKINMGDDDPIDGIILEDDDGNQIFVTKIMDDIPQEKEVTGD